MTFTDRKHIIERLEIIASENFVWRNKFPVDSPEYKRFDLEYKNAKFLADDMRQHPERYTEFGK